MCQVMMANQVLGKHVGIPYYTVGQRRGIKISDETPFYVVKIDVENNKILKNN